MYNLLENKSYQIPLTPMGKPGRFLRFTVAAAFSMSLALPGLCQAVAMPMQQAQHEDESAQSSGVVTPSLATGFIKADEWSHFSDGSLAIGWCAQQAFVGCATHKWLTPADAVKKLVSANVRYAGFQLFVLKDGPQLYLYYKKPAS
jgi:hypothetical protein